MKSYKCRMGIEKGHWKDCPALTIGGCGMGGNDPVPCDAIEVEVVSAAALADKDAALREAEGALDDVMRCEYREVDIHDTLAAVRKALKEEK